MRIKQLSVLAFLLVSVSSFSQDIVLEKPDYKKIESEISNVESEFYYPKLLKMYLNSDTSMTLKEKRHLYYGYSFQDKYAPYHQSDFSDSLRAVLQKEQHNGDELKKIIRYSDSLLVDNPFDLNAINYQLYAFEKLYKRTEFERKMIQMRMVVDALLSSGDGLKKSTAFYVIYTAHEYDLLNILGFEFGGQQSLVEHYDYLEVEKNSRRIKGFYFDVSPCLNSLKLTLE